MIGLGGLTQGKLEKLQAVDLNTIGDLSDWLKGPPLRNYCDLPGIGKTWVEKLENAMEKFWSERGYALDQAAQQPTPAVPADGPTVGEVVDAEYEITDDEAHNDGEEVW